MLGKGIKSFNKFIIKESNNNQITFTEEIYDEVSEYKQWLRYNELKDIKFNIATEGVSDVVRTIVAKLKEWFNRFVDFLKVMWDKVVTFFKGYDRKINNAIYTLQNIKKIQSGNVKVVSVSEKFKNAVAAGDLATIRLFLCNTLLLDATFRDFAEMEKLAANVPGLYVPYDQAPMEADQSRWDDDYLARQKIELEYNFCPERIEHVKAVVLKLHSPREKEFTVRYKNDATNDKVFTYESIVKQSQIIKTEILSVKDDNYDRSLLDKLDIILNENSNDNIIKLEERSKAYPNISSIEKILEAVRDNVLDSNKTCKKMSEDTQVEFRKAIYAVEKEQDGSEAQQQAKTILEKIKFKQELFKKCTTKNLELMRYVLGIYETAMQYLKPFIKALKSSNESFNMSNISSIKKCLPFNTDNYFDNFIIQY